MFAFVSVMCLYCVPKKGSVEASPKEKHNTFPKKKVVLRPPLKKSMNTFPDSPANVKALHYSEGFSESMK
jgi:hypothetical protein